MNVEAMEGLIKAAGEVVKKWKDEKAADVLIEIARQKREIENVMSEDMKPHKEALSQIKDEYTPYILALEEASDALRESVKGKHVGEEPIEVEGGSIVFPMRWGYTVMELGKVPREYMTVNGAKVTEEMRRGVRKIPGILIEQKRGVEVRPKW